MTDDMDHSDRWAPAPAPIQASGPDPGPDRSRRFRRNVVAVGAAVGLTLGGFGIAAAQTTTTTPAPAAGTPTDPMPPHGPRGGGPGGPGRPGPGASLATVAKAIGISEADLQTALHDGQSIAQVSKAKGVDPAKVITALVDEAKARLAEDVKAGRLTQAQADERAANLEARITEHVNHVGGGPGGPGGPDGPDHGGPGRGGPGLAAAAKAIGISEADLHTALGNGQSIAQVSEAKGVDPAKVIAAMVEEAKAKLAEQAANLQARITEQVNRVGGGGPGGGHRGP